jgi:hypothetical protein
MLTWIGSKQKKKEKKKERQKKRRVRLQEKKVEGTAAVVQAASNRQSTISTAYSSLLSSFKDEDGNPPGPEILAFLQSKIEEEYCETADIYMHGERREYNTVLKGFSHLTTASTATKALIDTLVAKENHNGQHKKRRNVISTKRCAQGCELGFALLRAHEKAKNEAASKERGKINKAAKQIEIELGLVEKHMENVAT